MTLCEELNDRILLHKFKSLRVQMQCDIVNYEYIRKVSKTYNSSKTSPAYKNKQKVM